MTYAPRRAPRRRTFHRKWTSAYVANSERGAVLAQEEGCRAIDNDWHLSKRGRAWINAHGAPERFWLPRGQRFEWHESAHLFGLERHDEHGRAYHIRDLREALEDNHRRGLDTEAEVKDVRPWATEAILSARFAQMARVAESVYGPSWRRHFLVKVLTDLGGGEKYALKICRFAHAAGIPTMLLVRGHCRFKRYRGHPEITYVRGSLVIR